MVTIRSNQQVAENPKLRVVVPDSDYADTDLILCADVQDLGLPIAMYQAQFVKYGSVVYQFNTPEDLGKAIFAIDPDSTLDSVALYKEQVARDAARAAGTLTPGNPDPVDTPPVEDPTDQATTTPDVPQTPAGTSTSTPEVPDPAPEVSTTTPDTGTTTPDVPYDPDAAGNALTAPDYTPDSTTTPAVEDVASSTLPIVDASPTPPDVPAVDLSTTTPE